MSSSNPNEAQCFQPMPTKKKISLPFAFFTALSCCTSCLLCRSHCDTCHSSGSRFKNDSHGPALLIFFRHNVPEQEMTGGKKTGNRIAELLVCLFFCFFTFKMCVSLSCLVCVCVCMPWRRRSLGCSCMLFCSFATVIWSLGWRSLKLRSVDRLWVDFEFEPTSCLLLWLVYAQHFLTGVFHQGGLLFFFFSHTDRVDHLFEEFLVMIGRNVVPPWGQ